MPDSTTLKYLTAGAFVVYGGLATSYWVDTNDVNINTCQEPVISWATFSKYFLLISLLSMVVIYSLNLAWQYRYNKLRKTIIWLLAFPNVGLIVYVIGSFIAFHNRDKCSPLYHLLIVNFLFSLLICLSPLVFLFMLYRSEGFRPLKTLFNRREKFGRDSLLPYAATTGDGDSSPQFTMPMGLGSPLNL